MGLILQLISIKTFGIQICMRVVQVSALGQTATGWAVLRRPDISEHSLSVAMWQENKGSVLTGITVCLAVLKDL